MANSCFVLFIKNYYKNVSNKVKFYFFNHFIKQRMSKKVL